MIAASIGGAGSSRDVPDALEGDCSDMPSLLFAAGYLQGQQRLGTVETTVRRGYYTPDLNVANAMALPHRIGKGLGQLKGIQE
jgi:hypothetical protein